MTTQNLIAVIQVDQERLETWDGLLIVNLMTELRETVERYGACNYYIVHDVKTFEKFKAEIKRLNP